MPDAPGLVPRDTSPREVEEAAEVEGTPPDLEDETAARALDPEP